MGGLGGKPANGRQRLVGVNLPGRATELAFHEFTRPVAGSPDAVINSPLCKGSG